ncbi:poliketide synthase (plasmid) [Candidatus Burkholderia crenata]|nr:poliketide synthase [Candidatus Burkholderia crenata]
MNYPASRNHNEPIVIIGMACRFPLAASIREFWSNQLEQKHCITQIPTDRWIWEDYDGDPSRDAGRTNSKWGAFLKDIDHFDPLYFGISPSEAEVMDPQHRLFVKTVWEALLDAGYRPEALAKSNAGVFVGVQFQEYQQLLIAAGILSSRVCTGNAHTMLANRVSYLLDISGPSEVIDTSCSSSLVALAHAVSSLRKGDCTIAIAGGANLILVPDVHVMGSQLGVLSSTGRCRPLDQNADGYVRGEGVGTIVLKTLRQAEEDGDHIYAVVRGIAVNHGGRATSLTAPGSASQSAVMKLALADARVEPKSISFVEMHATGTVVGDPTEYDAVKTALAQTVDSVNTTGMVCALSSVKSNIGHLEAASGIAGVINTALALENKWLPGMASFESINPKIDFTGTPFYVTRYGCEWPELEQAQQRRALVNSFGFGGTNCSAVLEEYRKVHDDLPLPVARGTDELSIPLSTFRADDMPGYCLQLRLAIDHIRASDVSDKQVFLNVVSTLRVGRDSLPYRKILRCGSVDELSSLLRSIAAGEVTCSAPTDTLDFDTQATGAVEAEWLRGMPVSWSGLAGAKRVSLPTPAWSEQSYWFADPSVASEVSHQSKSSTFTYLSSSWVKHPLATLEVAPLARENHVLVIATSESEASRFQKQIVVERPQALISSLVLPWFGLQSIDATTAYAALAGELHSLRIMGHTPDAVFVLTDEFDGEKYDGDLASGSLIAPFFGITKTLYDVFFRDAIQLFLVIRFQGEATPPQRAVSAFAKSVFLENKRFVFHTVFVEQSENDGWRADVIKEWNSLSSERPRVLQLTRGNRFLEQLHVANSIATAPTHHSHHFRRGGVYLIPGGAGELGHRFAGELALRYDAKIVIVGRSPEEGERAERVRFVRSMARAPSDVRYFQCDLTSLGSVNDVVRQTCALYERLDGVVSLATDHQDSFVFKKTWDEFGRISAAKVRGTVNLDEATRNLDLDLFLLFSSQAALGIAGGSDYAYGCAFQNEFVRYRNRRVSLAKSGGKACAVNWSRWKWDKHATPEFDAWVASLGYDFLGLKEGFDSLEAILASGMETVFALYGNTNDIVSNMDLGSGLISTTANESRWVDVHPKSARRDVEHAVEQLSETELLSLANDLRLTIPTNLAQEEFRHQHVDDQFEQDESTADLKLSVCAVLSKTLKIDEIDADVELSSLGVDSIIAVDVVVALEDKFSIEMHPTWLFEFPTVNLLTNHIVAVMNRKTAEPIS